MADYLKSAFNYFSTPPVYKTENDFVGKTVHIDKLSLRVKRTIAEGGFSVVFEAQDNASANLYALKKLVSYDKASEEVIRNEIKILKVLNGHPNIIKFHNCTLLGSDKNKRNGSEYLILTELCSGGQLTDYMPLPREGRPFPPNLIIQIMHQTCRAVQHIHNQTPPLIHRDLKVENLLLSDQWIIKLCDFGSATSTIYNPDNSWSSLQRGIVQEELEKFTTPMYRSPEMLDLYLDYPISTAADIWALGCILYFLVCTYHPFEDSAKLAILNANYNLPQLPSEYGIFRSLIESMLQVDPRQRPSINTVLSELSELAAMRELRVSGSISLLTKSRKRDTDHGAGDVELPQQDQQPQQRPNTEMNRVQTEQVNPSHITRPPVPTQQPFSKQIPPVETVMVDDRNSNWDTFPQNSGANPSGRVFGFIKGGAGNLFRNIRDASSKVLESVSSSFLQDVDFQLITSRIAVMSYPVESGFEAVATGTNRMEDVQSFLDDRYPHCYAVYNLSSRPYRADHWFDGRVSHRPFQPHQAPTLRSLYELCLNARLWLSKNPSNICIIHCTDGRALSSILVCSILCFCGLFDNVCPALQLFSSRRGNPHLNASQKRYIDYVTELAHKPSFVPHHRPLSLISLIITPVPTFNKTKNGCRPFVEVYENSKKVLTTLTDFSQMRSYTLEDQKIEILLNGLSVMGELTVVVSHCRSSFAGSGKIGAVKIAQFQIHTGFVEPDQNQLVYFKSDLDHMDTSSGFAGFTSRYAESFHIILDFMVSPTDRPRHGDTLFHPWEMNRDSSTLHPEYCVSDEDELRELMVDFGNFNRQNKVHIDTQSASGVSDASDNAVHSKTSEKQPDFECQGVRMTTHVNNQNDKEAFIASSVPDTSVQDANIGDLLGFDKTQPGSFTTEDKNNFTTFPEFSNQKQSNDDTSGVIFFDLTSDSSNANVKAPDPIDVHADLFDDLLNIHSQSEMSSQTQSPSFTVGVDMYDLFGMNNHDNKQNTDNLHPPGKPTSTGMYTSASYNGLSGNVTNPFDPFDQFCSDRARHSAGPSPVHRAQPSEQPPTTSSTPSRGSTSGPKQSFQSQSASTGIHTRIPRNAFSDLLNDFGHNIGAEQSPSKSINELRREQLPKDTDPDMLKVQDWSCSKERNVRALLCSLPAILWETVRWRPITLADLMTAEQVKKQYRNAARVVHPDKWMNTEHENLARLILIELNDAMTEFEKGAS